MTIKVFRYSLTLHYSWFILFGLLTWGLSTEFLKQATEQLPLARHWVVATLATSLILGSVLLHELAHAFVAEHYGLKVTGISLNILGGWTTFVRESQSPKLTALIVLAGPACSLLLAALAWPFRADLIGDTLYKVNLVIGTYNLFIPCLPLDGGRLLHTWLWQRSGSFSKAWEQTAQISKQLSLGMMFVAILGFVLQYQTLWIFFIAIVLRLLADQAYKPVAYSQQLSNSIRHLMVPRPGIVSITAQDTLAELKTLFLRHGYAAYPVTNPEGLITGLVRYRDAQQSPDWMTDQRTPLAAYITPIHDTVSISADAPLVDALDKMIMGKLEQLLVLEGSSCVGWITRSMITRVQDALRHPGDDSKPSADLTQPIWHN